MIRSHAFCCMFTAAVGMLSIEAASADVLYSLTTDIGYYNNHGTSIVGTPGATQPDIIFDDVALSLGALGSGNAITVTRITFQVTRNGTVSGINETNDFTLFWAQAPTTAAPLPEFHSIGTKTFEGGSTWYLLYNLTFGDGTTPLFTAPLDFDLNPGYGSLLIGLQASNPNVYWGGWSLAGTDETGSYSSKYEWVYDSDSLPGELYLGEDPEVNISYYLVVEGYVTTIPEPASMLFLTLGAASLLFRKR